MKLQKFSRAYLHNAQEGFNHLPPHIVSASLPTRYSFTV